MYCLLSNTYKYFNLGINSVILYKLLFILIIIQILIIILVKTKKKNKTIKNFIYQKKKNEI